MADGAAALPVRGADEEAAARRDPPHWSEVPAQRMDGAQLGHGSHSDAALRAAAGAYHDVVEHASDAIFLLDCPDQQAPVFVTVNAAFEQAIGVHRSALVRRAVQEVLPPGLCAEFLPHWRRCMATGKATHYEGVLAGTRRLSFTLTLLPVFDAQGMVRRMAGVARDVTVNKAAEAVLRARAEEMTALVEYSPDHILRIDRAGQVAYVNPSMLRSLDLPRHQVWGRSMEALLAGHPSLESYLRGVWQVLATGQATELDIVRPAQGGGRRRHEHVHLVPDRGEDGLVRGVISIGRDLTRQKELEHELALREATFRELVENSPDTIARYDRGLRRVYANPALLAQLGVTLNVALGSTPAQVPGGRHMEIYEQRMRAVFESGQEGHVELRWRSGGRKQCIHIRMRPEFDVDGRVSHILAVGREITEFDEYRRTIHRQAFYDALTGLPNRTLLNERIQQAIAASLDQPDAFGLMVMDLDHFKEINDTLGHTVGDQLLREVGSRLQTCARARDTVARLGGDEFAMLLQVPRAHLARVAVKFLAALNQPFVIDGHELFVTGSIGIAMYADDGSDFPTLYKHADSAMYHAKRLGRNHHQFYRRELTQQVAERREIETALRKALRHDELELYYQPQVELRTGCMVGAEALLRWNRPGHGVVGPQQFVGVAEGSGLIVEIGDWVLAAACASAARWNRGRARPLQLAVNLSPRQFQRNDLVSTVRRQLHLSGCQPSWLKLEITESLLLDGDHTVAGMLDELNAMGVALSIDDFGTGYSALSYLHRFPVRQLKIDRSFVCDVPAERSKSELVKAMLSIAGALRLETVAEGVETEAQAAYLIEHGCLQAQGYLFGKPMPRTAFEQVLGLADNAREGV